jgi:hypothetical protein
VRDAVAPAAGDLVITELMANPSSTDDGKEWFEVRVQKDVDLVGLELGTVFPDVADRLTGPECRRVTAGSLLVFAGNDGDLPDGGLPRVDFRFDFTLVNADRGLFLGAAGALVDAVTYAATTSGAARSLSGTHIDATENDDLGLWCDATLAYGDGDLGTPGVANPECLDAVPTGKCLDGVVLRDIVPPAAGDVLITEVLADAEGADEGKEWFEINVQRDVDLNGLEIGVTFPDGGEHGDLGDLPARRRRQLPHLLQQRRLDHRRRAAAHRRRLRLHAAQQRRWRLRRIRRPAARSDHLRHGDRRAVAHAQHREQDPDQQRLALQLVRRRDHLRDRGQPGHARPSQPALRRGRARGLLPRGQPGAAHQPPERRRARHQRDHGEPERRRRRPRVVRGLRGRQPRPEWRAHRQRVPGRARHHHRDRLPELQRRQLHHLLGRGRRR